MSPKPVASVCIATYNHARFLPECLDSILAQTYQDYEIVIVDDGSQDGSHELLLNYQSRFPDRIRYYWHPGHENRGVSITTNVAIQNSSGAYISFIGSDDIWYPQTLERQVSTFKDIPDVGIVYGIAEYVDEKGRSLPGKAGQDITQAVNPLGNMLVLNYTPAMTVMVRRECLDRVGLFREAMAYSDWDLMVRLFSHYRAAYIDMPLAKYRVHGNNMSIGTDPNVSIRRNLDVLHSLKSDAALIGGALVEPRNMAILNLQIAFHLFCSGDVAEAQKYLEEAYENDPGVYTCEDSIAKWSNWWRQEFYHASSKHFGFWVLANFPVSQGSAVIKQELQRQLVMNPETKRFFIEQGVRWCKRVGGAGDLDKIFEGYGTRSLFPSYLREEVVKKTLAAMLFLSYEGGDVVRARKYFGKAVMADPRLLVDRGVISLGVRMFVLCNKWARAVKGRNDNRHGGRDGDLTGEGKG